jgi:hypothetical protein
MFARPHPVACRILACEIDLDLLRPELQAMTAFRSAIQLQSLASVAAMQEQMRNCDANCRIGRVRSDY